MENRIESLTVTVNSVNIDGKKLTKTILKNLDYISPEDWFEVKPQFHPKYSVLGFFPFSMLIEILNHRSKLFENQHYISNAEAKELRDCAKGVLLYDHIKQCLYISWFASITTITSECKNAFKKKKRIEGLLDTLKDKTSWYKDDDANNHSFAYRYRTRLHPIYHSEKNVSQLINNEYFIYAAFCWSSNSLFWMSNLSEDKYDKEEEMLSQGNIFENLKRFIDESKAKGMGIGTIFSIVSNTLNHYPNAEEHLPGFNIYIQKERRRLLQKLKQCQNENAIEVDLIITIMDKINNKPHLFIR